jgi:hypothetical protein
MSRYAHKTPMHCSPMRAFKPSNVSTSVIDLSPGEFPPHISLATEHMHHPV